MVIITQMMVLKVKRCSLSTWSPRKASLIGKNLFLDRSVWLCSICKDENRYKLRWPSSICEYLYGYVKVDKDAKMDLPRQPTWWEHDIAKCFVQRHADYLWDFDFDTLCLRYRDTMICWILITTIVKRLLSISYGAAFEWLCQNPKENLMAFFPLKTSWLSKPCVFLRAGQGCGTEGS